MNSFVERAQQNDSALFPSIEGNADLRALAIRKSIEELGKIKLTNSKLKHLIEKMIRRFDAHRVQNVKKIKPAERNETTSDEFQLLKPYLDLTYPQQRDGPLNAPANSLLNVYWKIRDAQVSGKLAGSRSFWR